MKTQNTNIAPLSAQESVQAMVQAFTMYATMANDGFEKAKKEAEYYNMDYGFSFQYYAEAMVQNKLHFQATNAIKVCQNQERTAEENIEIINEELADTFKARMNLTLESTTSMSRDMDYQAKREFLTKKIDMLATALIAGKAMSQENKVMRNLINRW